MIDYKKLDGRFEMEAFGTLDEVMRSRFNRSDTPKTIISEIIAAYKKKPEMIRDRTYAAVFLFELLHPKDAGAFSEMEASCLERIVRPTMLKITSGAPEY